MQDTAMTDLFLLAKGIAIGAAIGAVMGVAIGFSVLTWKTWPDIKEPFDRALWSTVMIVMPWTSVAFIVAKLLGAY
jgi:Mg/Co/Ni transporter MgtE